MTFSLFLVNTVAFASEPVHEALKPYINVMQSLNEEIGSHFGIAPQDELTVYNNLKNMTLDQFEENLRYEFNNVIKGLPKNMTLIINSGESEDSPVPFAAFEYSRTQNKSYLMNTTVWLQTFTRDSSGRLTYLEMEDFGTKATNSREGFIHTGPDSISGHNTYTISATRADLHLTGEYVSKEGIRDLVTRYIDVTFYA